MSASMKNWLTEIQEPPKNPFAIVCNYPQIRPTNGAFTKAIKYERFDDFATSSWVGHHGRPIWLGSEAPMVLESTSS